MNTEESDVFECLKAFRSYRSAEPTRFFEVVLAKTHLFCISARVATVYSVFLLAAVASNAQDTTYIQWDPPQQISFDPYNSVDPQIVAVGDTVHLMWTASNGPEAFYSRSSDAGATWSSPITLDDTVISYQRFSAAGAFVYLFMARCSPPCGPKGYLYVIDLRRSEDAGITWLPRTLIDPGASNVTTGVASSKARDSVVAFSNYRVGLPERFAWSSNTGVSWNYYIADADFDDRFVILPNGIHLVRRQIGVGLPRAEVSYLYSSDFGQTWTPYMFLSSPDSIMSDGPDIAGDDERLYAVWRDFKYGGFVDGTILFRRSTDSGVTWQEEIRLTPLPVGVDPRVASEGSVVAALWTSSEGLGVQLRLSTDYGITFLPMQIVSLGGDGALALKDRRVHVAWWAEVNGNAELFYRRGQIVMTGVSEEPNWASSHVLFQNYPNPFNAQTTFRYSIPRRTHVRMVIYDALGREVEISVDEMKEAGLHIVRYDGSHLASGVYFYRILTPGYVAVKKFAVIK